MKDRKGFTLIELIIVVAILTALTTLLGFSLSLIFSTQAKRCSDSIDSILSQTKIDAMSREGGAFVCLYTEDGSVKADYYVSGALQSTETIGDRRCSVTFRRGTETAALGEKGSGTCLYISFLRDTGAFDFSKNTGWSSGDTCTGITVSGGTKTYVIKLYPATGGHTLEG